MEGYSFRPTSIDDLSIVHQLITRQNILDFGEPLRTAKDIQRGWNVPGFQMRLDSQLAVAPNGQVAGYAELLNKEDLFIYLSHDHQVPDLANKLLGFLVNRARSQKNEVVAVQLWSQVGFRNQVLVDTLEANGFTSDISFLVMEIELAEAPSTPQWPDGIQVRAFVKGRDDQATYQTDEEAAEDKGYHSPLSFEKWTIRMGMDKTSFDPKIWFLACDQQEIAGVALNAYKEESRVSWVDHLSVRRVWRNKGIGRALLLHTFGEFFKRGIRTIKLSVDSKSLTNAPRLYESVGMKTIQKYHVYKKAI